ncbi:riboflavin synthase [Williamsia sterculiae]|uniref:Riboflavin synthase n=1 Tax=Williamsia sterculiae TaxID=1344003 RepID=A0A1N7EIA6_9NOCA|nr:riboflavin synthase [Williamsia sterculiae]SIR87882.1 riboflavin synthase alpha chain [Williamsia sterculiae]
MFTGIVEECGVIVARTDLDDAARLTVRGPLVTSDAGHGDSISVNGVCLTVVESPRPDEFTVDVMGETLARSSLTGLGAGSRVNLERAMAAGGRFGGHIVQGHVDATGTVSSVTPHENWTVIRFTIDPGVGRYIVEKGSITVDGVSLTVSGLSDSGVSEPAAADAWFEVSLIPTTLQVTTLGDLVPSAVVNLETDVIARYVERLAVAPPSGQPPSGDQGHPGGIG